MGMLTKRLLVMVMAIVLAAICRSAFSGWLNIIPWALGAIIVGQISINRWDVVINGALFGYLLFATYIICGYTGNTDVKSITNIAVFILLFSVIGAVAGVAGAFVGNLIREKTGGLDKLMRENHHPIYVAKKP